MTCKKDLVDHQRTQVFILNEDKSWTQIGDLMDIKPPKASYNEDDVTTLADTDKTVVTAGAREHSNVEVTLLKRTESEIQRRLYLSNYHGTCERFKIVLPDQKNTTVEFSGYIKEFGDETDPAKKTRIAMSITVSGKVGQYNDDGYITPEFISEGEPISPLVIKFEVSRPEFTAFDDTGEMTIVFNQKVTGLTIDSFIADNLQLSNLRTADNITYTADITANSGVYEETNFITLKAGSYKNASGRTGAEAKSVKYAMNTA